MVEVRTRLFAGRRRARSEISIAAVHDDTPSACLAPTQRAKSDSNAITSGPLVTQPDARTRSAAWRAREVITVRVNGIGSVATTETAMTTSFVQRRARSRNDRTLRRR